jgi:glutamyl-Q tRNA(Asp) synthetase
MPAPYRGRFAPSPTGPLHAGSLVAALASWLDARAHGGQWLVRIEDVDLPRTVTGASQRILEQLAACGLIPDEVPTYQSARTDLYQAALNTLVVRGLAYPCSCSRKEIELAVHRQSGLRPRHSELVYPGTCRSRGQTARSPGQGPCAWRLLTEPYKQNGQLALDLHRNAAITSIAEGPVQWVDRLASSQLQDVASDVGDFVLKRADGCFTYQMAVVVDDAAQGITDIVRGADLMDNTARQVLLQRALGFQTPRYLHTPLVLDASGEKLSKQNGAQPLDTSSTAAARTALAAAAQGLGLTALTETQCMLALQSWMREWKDLFAVSTHTKV